MKNTRTNLRFSRRAEAVTPFLAMEVFERAKELEAGGRDIVYLCVGEPDFPSPAVACDAAIRAIRGGRTTYTHSLGLPELREAIAEHYARRYGVVVDPGRIIVSSGTSPLMFLLFSALLDKGDEIILPDPCYSCYPNFIRFPGGNPCFLRTREEDGFQPRPEEVRSRITPRTRGVFVNSPSNPAGSILPSAWLEELASLPIPLISDEVYHGLTYEGEERSALEFDPDAFVFGGFSKTFAMTGWRLGYLIVPPSSVRVMQSLHQNFMISANHFVQQAGIAVLREGRRDVEIMRAAYDRRRRHIVERLRALGLGVRRMPQGAFYVLADARSIHSDSLKLAMEILEATGVAVTPGIDFGEGAQGYLRFSYANSTENIDKAMDRLQEYLTARK
ncbi:MAG: pyridoxal phosphate-dependent aminotransferase [Deltaproteobacteria bacterium]|nr:MAG: pyridoxal phosphate-dependent aminotransferase [Deltaproteobacteria bacterium]